MFGRGKDRAYENRVAPERRRFLPRFGRNMGFIGGIASVIGLVLTVTVGFVTLFFLIWKYDDPATVSQFYQSFLLLVTFAIIALSLSLAVAYWSFGNVEAVRSETTELIKAQRSLENQQDMFRILEALSYISSQNKRRVALRVRNLSDATDENYEKLMERIIGNWRKFSDEYINLAAMLFRYATGETVCGCIKIVGWPMGAGEQPTVETLIRDDNNKRNRVYVDKHNGVYAASSNSAFNYLMTDETFDKVYACDDLKGDPNYLNVNEDWSRYYNSTLVARIGSQHYQIDHSGHDEHVGYDLIGFLCFDSRNAKFDSSYCKDLAKLVANIYNEYLNYVARLFYSLSDEKIRQIVVTKDHDHDESDEHVAKIMRLLDISSKEKFVNRPLGLFQKRTINTGISTGVRFARTPMIIYQMYQDWSRRSYP